MNAIADARYPDSPMLAGAEPSAREKSYAEFYVRLLIGEQPHPELAVEMLARCLAEARERAVRLEHDPIAKAEDARLEHYARLHRAAGKSDNPPVC